MLKTLSPVAFASAAGYYFLPHTTRNLLGVDQPSYDKWATSHTASSSSSHSSTSALPRAELVSKAREAWHTAEVKADNLDSKIDNKTKEVKQWWNKNASIAEDTIKTQVNDAKSKASDAIDSAKGWVEDRSRLVERTVQSASSSIPSGSPFLKSKPEETWSHHEYDRHPESSTHLFSTHSSTSGAAGIGAAGAASSPESHDHWSTGEEQGTSKIREDGGYWIRRADFNRNTRLDNKDVDVWSSTKEEMGTARMDETPYANSHRNIFIYGHLPHETEYWTNGEEISSADVRDASYYSWPGSHNSTSLGRSSWWDRRFRSSPADLDASTAIRSSSESINWESKRAAERSALDLANRLAQEQSDLEKKAADAKARAEAAARQAKATSDALIRERQISMERSAKELEEKLANQRAQKAAYEAKVRGEAEMMQKKLAAEKAAKEWEIQKKLASERAVKAARELEIRLTREREEAAALEKNRAAERAAKEMERVKAIERAEATAREAKARAEAMLLEKKRHAEFAAKEMERVRAIEKAEAAARDVKFKAESLLLEQKRTAEKAETEALAAKNRAESNLAERKRAAELSARETSNLISREHTARLEREARLRSQLGGLKTEMGDTASSASSSSSGGSWSWPWSRSSTTSTTSTSTKHTHDHEGYDSTGHLLEHIVEDIKQTKDDLSDGLHHLKDAVLGAEAKAAEATAKSKETIVEAVNAAKPEGRGWWSSSSSYSTSTPNISAKVSDLGTNVERVAVKAERDVKAKAETMGRNMADSSRKAYDNVIDAATTAEGQRTYSHHHHEHPVSSTGNDDHTLMDHIRDDFLSTKENIQSGVDSLKETVFGAEQAANKAAADIQDGVKQATDEGRRWWSAKTQEAEKSANRLESELRAGLNKASDKIHEFDDSLNSAAGREASDDDYWFHAEQARQQQSRRGSGRAM